jgi:hypothetical protein
VLALELPVVLAPVVAATVELVLLEPPAPVPVEAAVVLVLLEPPAPVPVEADVDAVPVEADVDPVEADVDEDVVPPLPPRHSPTPPGNMPDLSHLPLPQSVSSQQVFTQMPLSHVSPPAQKGPLLASHSWQTFWVFGAA